MASLLFFLYARSITENFLDVVNLSLDSASDLFNAAFNLVLGAVFHNDSFFRNTSRIAKETCLRTFPTSCVRATSVKEITYGYCEANDSIIQGKSECENERFKAKLSAPPVTYAIPATYDGRL